MEQQYFFLLKGIYEMNIPQRSQMNSILKDKFLQHAPNSMLALVESLREMNQCGIDIKNIPKRSHLVDELLTMSTTTTTTTTSNNGTTTTTTSSNSNNNTTIQHTTLDTTDNNSGTVNNNNKRIHCGVMMMVACDHNSHPPSLKGNKATVTGTTSRAKNNARSYTHLDTTKAISSSPSSSSPTCCFTKFSFIDNSPKLPKKTSTKRSSGKLSNRKRSKNSALNNSHCKSNVTSNESCIYQFNQYHHTTHMPHNHHTTNSTTNNYTNKSNNDNNNYNNNNNNGNTPTIVQAYQPTPITTISSPTLNKRKYSNVLEETNQYCSNNRESHYQYGSNSTDSNTFNVMLQPHSYNSNSSHFHAIHSPQSPPPNSTFSPTLSTFDYSKKRKVVEDDGSNNSSPFLISTQYSSTIQVGNNCPPSTPLQRTPEYTPCKLPPLREFINSLSSFPLL